MKLTKLTLTIVACATAALASHAQEAKGMEYPPLSAYLMGRDAEIALAKSAAPPGISGRATIKVFTPSGFEVAREGDNGFVCLVMRGFTGAPTFTPEAVRAIAYDPSTAAPICFDPRAVKTVLPYYELRTHLGIQGKTPEQIAESIKQAYDNGTLPKRNEVSFA
jgi:hypothetical protein